MRQEAKMPTKEQVKVLYDLMTLREYARDFVNNKQVRDRGMWEGGLSSLPPEIRINLAKLILKRLEKLIATLPL